MTFSICQEEGKKILTRYVYVWAIYNDASSLHELIVAYDFHSNFLTGSGQIPRTDDVTEHTLPGVAVNIVSFVQHLTDVHPWTQEGNEKTRLFFRAVEHAGNWEETRAYFKRHLR